MLRKLLVVDDNETNRDILNAILCDEYEILEAENGSEAISVLTREHENISAMLLDIIMPVMDGYQVLEKLHADAQLSKIPVIVTTSNTGDNTELKALALGANDFISKPYNPEVVKHRLNNIINLRETAAAYNALKKDELTGLPTRKVFFDGAAEMIAAKPAGYYTIACFDIDQFKVINDRYGSKKGDDVLKMLADIFSKRFSKIDGICSRIAADTFGVLYPTTFNDSPESKQIQRLAMNLDGSIPPIAFSIGRYIIDDLTLPVSAMYDRASIAKASVKGRFDKHIAEYDESMRAALLHEQKIVDEMENALETEQFEVWLQPQFNHSGKSLVGAEALVRWRNPESGQIISPGDFIPIFERNGFIYELDKYVWERSCMLLRKWLDAGSDPLPISVNISRYDVFHEDFVDTITGLMAKYDLPTELLRLEITESAFVESMERIISVVEHLIEHGFTIEIDDFGSGYSSLNTLKDVPAHVIKLDMRFLESSRNSERGGNILQSIVRMAKWLNMSIIAEGVETQEQADYLESIGCNYMQGYLYAKPMPVSEYETLAGSTDKEEKKASLETVDKLDNNTFWDPQSMETLIFNSYVGAACIFEIHNEEFELLRVNQQYVRELFGDESLIDTVLELKLTDYMDEANIKALYENIRKAIDTGNESTVDCVATDFPNRPGQTYIRSSVRVIAKTGDRYLLYAKLYNTTEQRRIEQKVRESDAQLRAIINNVNGGVFASIQGENRLEDLFTNDCFYSILGYTREQYRDELPRGLYDTVHPDDREALWRLTTENNEFGDHATLDFRIYKRDKSLIWVRGGGCTCSIDGIEKPVHIGVLNDITAEKETELQLKARYEHELQLRRYLIEASDNYFELNLTTGMVMAYHSKYHEIPALSEPIPVDEDFSNKILQLVAEEDRAAVVDTLFIDGLLRRHAAGENEVVLEYHRILPDGSLCLLRGTAIILTNPGSEEVTAFILSRNIDKDDPAK